jgi:hypothetical protein
MKPMETEMKATVKMPRGSRWRLALVIVAAMTLLAFAIWEALASRSPARNDLPGWVDHVRRVDESLALKDLGAAIRAWHEAYGAALGSRSWEGMADVADAYLRIGEAAGLRKAWEPRAREAYLNALFRARRDGSLYGVLRVAQAFAALGDCEVVKQCLKIAERLAGDERDLRARVQAFREQWTATRRADFR